MKRTNQRMSAAVLVAAVFTGLISCGESDNPVEPSAPQIPAGLVGTWYCEYDAVGTAKADLEPGNAEDSYKDENPFLGTTVEMPDGSTVYFEEAEKDGTDAAIDYVHVIDVYDFYEVGEGNWRRFYFSDDDLVMPGMVWGDLGMGYFDFTVAKDGKINISLTNEWGQEYQRQWTVNFTGNNLTATGANGQSITLTAATEEQEETYSDWSSMLTPAGSSSQDRAILKEVNLCRTNPKKYAETRLKRMLKTFIDANTLRIDKKKIQMYNGKKEVQQAIESLKKMKPRKALKWNNKLWKAAQYHCKDLGPKGMFSHNSSNGQSAGARIKRFSGKSYSGECIGSGFSKAENVVTQLVVDYGYVGSKPHRDIIMSTGYKQMGAAIGKHRTYQYMSTLDFTN